MGRHGLLENFRIGPSLSNRIESAGQFEFESNLEASQFPTYESFLGTDRKGLDWMSFDEAA